MTWLLKKVPCKTFRRNSLATVIMQLRFHPILKVKERIADFQELVRPRFPGFDAIEAQTFEITSSGMGELHEETVHRFHAVSEPTKVSLGTSAVSIEYGAHQSRSVLLRDTETVLSALKALYAPVVPKRLGIRYVNLINRGQIAAALGRFVSWRDLLTHDFAKVPGGVAELDEVTTFLAEVTSPCDRGQMTLRYGIVPDSGPVAIPAGGAPSSERKFRLDTDRYVEGSFKFDEVRDLASGFVEDIFQVFMTAAGPALLEWMMEQGELS